MTIGKFWNSIARSISPTISRTALAALLIAFSVWIIPSQLYGQSDTGRITGTVADSTGALLPGATVTLTNTDTGATVTDKSAADGSFNFAAVMRGNYKIEVSDSGFENVTQTLSLQVSQVANLNFKMPTGGTTTTVDVTSSEPIIDTSTSSTGAVIEGKQVDDLPLNGRNFTQLALLTPGVTRGGFSSDASGRNGAVETFRYSESGGAAISANGLRQQSNNFLLDGVDNNESLVNTIVFFSPPEAIDQFRVTTSVAPAEFGPRRRSDRQQLHQVWHRQHSWNGLRILPRPDLRRRPELLCAESTRSWLPTQAVWLRGRRSNSEGQAVPFWRLPGLPPEAATGHRLLHRSDRSDAAG